MDFFTFLGSLQNPEKTRDFNRFQTYSLDPFENLLSDLKRTKNTNHLPKRISVVGTNGKGSTSHYLSSFLLSLRNSPVGTYTSPHLVTPLERISIDLQNISESKAESLWKSFFKERIQKLQNLSYFEFLTLFCFFFFWEEGTAWEVWEAGLGGRLDATKCVHADTIVMTKIGLDHCEILGPSKFQIAKEKIGIISHETRNFFCLYQKDKELENFISSEVANKGLSCQFFFPDKTYSSYLEENQAYALFVLKKLGFPSESLSVDPKKSVPGRKVTLSENPLWFFEPAHNPEAIQTILEEIRPDILFLGVLPDKDGMGILSFLATFAISKVFLLQREGFFSFSEGKLPNPNTFRIVTNLTPLLSERPVCGLVAGSFRLYAEAKEVLSK